MWSCYHSSCRCTPTRGQLSAGADGGATLSGQLDPPALPCPFTQPICEAFLFSLSEFYFHSALFIFTQPFFFTQPFLFSLGPFYFHSALFIFTQPFLFSLNPFHLHSTHFISTQPTCEAWLHQDYYDTDRGLTIYYCLPFLFAFAVYLSI